MEEYECHNCGKKLFVSTALNHEYEENYYCETCWEAEGEAAEADENKNTLDKNELESLKLLLEIVDSNLEEPGRPTYDNWFDGMDDEQAYNKLLSARKIIYKKLGV